MPQLPSREILCTVGPASLNERVLGRLEDLGVSLFRINLSHTKFKDLPRVVDFIRAHSRVPVCLDTEGAQVRTGDLIGGEVLLRENAIVHAHRQPVPGDAGNFNFYPSSIVDELHEGDFISVDFHAVLVQVIAKTPQGVAMRVVHGGVFGRNKAVTVERDLPLAALTAKDRQALQWGRGAGIRHVALSFANRGSDVDEVRAISGDGVFLISKIECRHALHNLDDIAARSDALLIDRGDLSRQEPIERIPSLQKMIIRRGAELGRRVYVATNLLESMISAPKPTRAEVNDVVNTLLDGADGLVLAAETAIGRDPVGCVGMIVKLIHEYDVHRAGACGLKRPYQVSDGLSLLVEPHGGTLVEQWFVESEPGAIDRMPRLAVDDHALVDAQQIALGGFSPLTGFMDSTALSSVLATNRLPDGTPWPLPILLPVSAADAARLRPGETVALAKPGEAVQAVVDVTEVYGHDLASLARQWLGEVAATHPGRRAIAAWSGHFVAGRVRLVRRQASPLAGFALTPRETRFVLQHKGWNRVVGHDARSPVIRLDEQAQLEALERAGADGLVISTRWQSGSRSGFAPEAVLRSYQAMLDYGCYPAGRVLLGVRPSFTRHGGAREVVFDALVQKNHGCSHVLIDLAAQGGDAGALERECRALFDDLGDLGVTPLFVGVAGPSPEDAATGIPLTAGEALARLSRDETLPDGYMRDVVQDVLRAHLAASRSTTPDHAFAD